MREKIYFFFFPSFCASFPRSVFLCTDESAINPGSSGLGKAVLFEPSVCSPVNLQSGQSKVSATVHSMKFEMIEVAIIINSITN